jgi:hypothetical protein
VHLALLNESWKSGGKELWKGRDVHHNEVRPVGDRSGSIIGI